MNRVADRYQNTLNRLQEQLVKRVPENQALAVGQFAALLYRSVSAREIEDVPIDDLYGSILEGWYFLQQRPADKPKIRVFNPDNEANGWASPHTIILILSDDRPFQIDSIRMEVNRRGLTLHSIQNVIVSVERDKGLLTQLSGYDHTQAKACESFVYMEIDRSAQPSEQRGLRQALEEVLEDVQAVTGDYQPMLTRADSVLDWLKDSVLPPGIRDELSTFIDWTIDNHFTFLGYEQHRLVRHQSGWGLRVVPASRLGLCNMPWGLHEPRLLADLPQQPMAALQLDDLIGFAKSSHPVRVHRAVYGDYILIREFDDAGLLQSEHRFLGLYTSPVYFQSPRSIPVVRTKVQAVLERAALPPGSHDWKELRQILETYPRDDLFQIDSDALFESALGVLHIHERRQIRLFVRRAAYRRYYSCLLYVPKDRYSTDLRLRVQQILCQAFNCQQVESNTHISESLLARTQFILHLESPAEQPDVDLLALEQQVIKAACSWQDELLQALVDHFGEAHGGGLFGRFNKAFPSAYRDDFSARSAVADIERMLPLNRSQPLAMSFYRPLEGSLEQLNFKLYHFAGPMPLSDVIPVMEYLGLIVRDEHPYAIKFGDQGVWIHDFGLLHRSGDQIELDQVREIFQQAFAHTWRGDAPSDSFNRLVLSAGLDWRQVGVLRAYAAYIKQTGTALSQEAIASILLAHTEVARLLLQIFMQRFDPDLDRHNDSDTGGLLRQFDLLLDQVSGLTDDRVLRRFYELILVTVRTNFFRLGDHRQRLAAAPDQATVRPSEPASVLVLKLMPQFLAEMPEPCPMFELFAHSARLEGVHLRAGKIARGGVRWSDRIEDYRTEVLGLLRAQQLKNALIVPVGAQGGFICRRLDDAMTAGQRQAEALACYQVFIGAMLEVTDNSLDGAVQHPERVVCYDEDDPYLVVAADNETASLGNSANAIAVQHQFWLGDAFASGGRQGYDLKAMAMIAQGAWVSVERHFRELGIDSQQGFSVVGIGSMAGDVFGKGMLLSEQVRLLAAFDQRSIFIDPNPDPAIGYTERRRLFELGLSDQDSSEQGESAQYYAVKRLSGRRQAGWDQYDPTLISAGGGVFSRSATKIAISPQMRQRLGTDAVSLSANALISALLKAPVDLLWNGAVGTYVKSRAENDADVGDKTNDGVRISADQLRCKVIVEGRSLGLTQAARVEFSLAGGCCNSDFIDSSAGLYCADLEVNIKILLDARQRDGELTLKQRNRLLADQAGQVVERVLADSLLQFEAISMAQAQSHERIGEYRRYIEALEQTTRLNREQASIPDNNELDRRRLQGQGLTRPELAVLIALTKGGLKQELLQSTLPDDPYLQPLLQQAFPKPLVDRFSANLSQHPLRRELIANQIANVLVTHMGSSFVHRMQSTAAAETTDVVRAYLLARDIYDLPGLWQQIEALDALDVRREVQMRMLLELQRMIRRATRWLLRNRQPLRLISDEPDRLRSILKILSAQMGNWLDGSPARSWQERFYFYSQAGVPEPLAKTIAGTTILYAALGMAEIVERGVELQQVVETYCLLGERLELFWFSRMIDTLMVANHWQASAREMLRDTLEQQLRRLGTAVLQQTAAAQPKSAPAARVADSQQRFLDWSRAHQLMISSWLGMLAELKSSDRQDYAIYAVAIQRLTEIAAVPSSPES